MLHASVGGTWTGKWLARRLPMAYEAHLRVHNNGEPIRSEKQEPRAPPRASMVGPLFDVAHL